jgi:copper chaperone CopZ
MIQGMTGSGSVSEIKEALKTLNDTEAVEVNLNNNNAIIDTGVSDHEIQNAMKDAGYKVIEIQNLEH